MIGKTGGVSWKTRGFCWEYDRDFGLDYGSSYWTVNLRSSTVEECEDVTSRLRKEYTEKEWKIGLKSLSPESTEVIFKNLNTCAVRKLDILETSLDSKCVSILSEILSDNKTMTDLRFRNCSLTGGIKQISDALFTNTTLKVLSLIDVTITDEDTSHLSTMLSINKTLDKLELTNCDITDNGVRYICEGLTKNQTLTLLNISDNPQITSVSTSTIAELINTTKSLRKLYVRSTSFTIDDLKTICTALCNNTSIRTLVLSSKHYEYCKKLDNYQVIEGRLCW